MMREKHMSENQHRDAPIEELRDRRGEHRRKRVLAILAACSVLGVGAAVTLAAWNDSEFARGQFTAGSFNLEGSTDGITYAEHPATGSAAALTFSVPVGNLAPGDKVAAPFWVRLDDQTTSGATLSAAGVVTDTSGTNNDAALSYSVYPIGDAATCTTSTTGTPIASGATLNAQTAGTAVSLTVGSSGNAGTAVQLCVVVTAGATLAEGVSSTATWKFDAVSS